MIDIPKITFCIPSKNNKRYLESCVKSIRKNSYRNDHDISIFVDKDTDGTVDWLKNVKDVYNLTYHINPDLNNSLYGIGKAYDYCIRNSATDIFMIFHADMMLAKGADLEAYKYLERRKVVCSTRIEPPLHPEGLEKIVKDFGMWPELDVKDGFKENEFNAFVEQCKLDFKGKTTNGCFAPWMMYKEDFEIIGMHDPIMKSAREDSDVFNRMILNGYTLIQSWESFVYHLTCRGGQFEHGVLTKDHSQKSKDWQILMHNSTLEFIRKWGSGVKHDEYLHPIVKKKYDVGVIVKNCNENVLQYLEPWFSTLYVDCDYDNYINQTQPNTKFDLSNKIRPYDNDKQNYVLIDFDAKNLTQDRFLIITEMLPDILSESAVIGDMEYDIFKFYIGSLESYEKKLITLDDIYFTSQLL
jgi:glycosyltransferase involved in cell wall biosynthesis